jgi:hypothetical protein
MAKWMTLKLIESIAMNCSSRVSLAVLILMWLGACATSDATLNQQLSAREIDCRGDIRVTHEEKTRDGFHRWVANCENRRYVCSYRESADAVCSRVESKDIEEETVYLRGDDD